MSTPTHRLLGIVVALTVLIAPAVPQAEDREIALLVENGLFVTMAAVDARPFRGFMTVGRDGRILGLAPGDPPDDLAADRLVDASGRIVMPGFVSGHNHLWQSAFRGLGAREELDGWLKVRDTYSQHMHPGDRHAFTLHGTLDMLAHGVTTVYNYAQRSRAAAGKASEEFEAAIDAGAHTIYSGRLDHSRGLDGARGDLQALIHRAGRLPAPSPILAISINTWPEAQHLADEVALAKELSLTVQIHLLEDFARRKHYRKKFWAMEKLGAVFPGMIFAHFIHTDERIRATAGKAGAAMIWNPLANGRLASGLPDIPAYQQHGIRVGMGLDGQASADVADPFENMRMGMYALRMQHHSAKVMTPSDVLYLHTLSTADLLGVADRVGSLEPGKLADFLIVDPHRPSTGPLFEPKATLVLACSAANIESVWVAGERRVERGRITTPDHHAVIADVERRVTAIKRRLTAVYIKPGDDPDPTNTKSQSVIP